MKDARILSHAGRNLLIVDGNETDITALGQITMETDYGHSSTVTFQPSRYATAEQIVEQAVAVRDALLPAYRIVIREIHLELGT